MDEIVWFPRTGRSVWQSCRMDDTTESDIAEVMLFLKARRAKPVSIELIAQKLTCNQETAAAWLRDNLFDGNRWRWLASCQ